MKSSCLARSTDCGIAIQLPRTDRPTVIPGGEDVKTGNLCAVFPSKKAFLIIMTRNPEGLGRKSEMCQGFQVCCLFSHLKIQIFCDFAQGLMVYKNRATFFHWPISQSSLSFISSVKVGLKLQGCVEIEVFLFGSCVFFGLVFPKESSHHYNREN